jgi:hypothetical protein
MADRKQINEEELDIVTGGQLTYTWDGSKGSFGVNGNNPYILLDKEAYLSYYNEVKDSLSELDIVRNLLAKGIIKKP